MNVKWSLLLLISTTWIGCKKPANCEVVAEVSGNHDHIIKVPANQLERGVGGVYSLKGGGHRHAVPLRESDMAALKSGKTVTTRATSVNAHTHEIAFRCQR
jgi:hypothetical protein